MDNPMILFDILILGYGLYILYGAIKMRTDKKPPKWLLSQSEQKKIRYPKDFCEYIAGKTIVFGVVCVAYGAFTLVENQFLDNSWIAEMISLVVFLVVVVWFLRELRKGKDQYI